ncbi:MAG: type II toxin-antitoxin system RelE/ParE family toxin [Frankiaceae bacterium]|nr:type II toxin-antitoxin system RelE/ParE family toxin [Frankiaceae bacterium]
MAHTVRLEHDAVAQLAAIEDYVTDQADQRTATNFVARILNACNGLGTFPHRGRSRDDIRPGLRITGYRRRVTIAFTVDDTTAIVTIVGVFYGGQDWESHLIQ